MLAAAVDAVFASDLATDVSYEGIGRVRVVLRHGTGDLSFSTASFSTASMIARIRRSDVPNPAEGDRLMVGDTIYQVLGAPRLSGRSLVWELGLGEAGHGLDPWEEAA